METEEVGKPILEKGLYNPERTVILMEETVTPAEIQIAFSQVNKTIQTLKGRTRLLGVKVKDIEEDLSALSSTLADLAQLPPTKDILQTLISYEPKVRPFLTDIRNAIRSLETISDKIEDLIP